MHKYQPHTTNWAAHNRSDLESKIGQRQICDYLKSECAMFRNFSQLEQCQSYTKLYDSMCIVLADNRPKLLCGLSAYVTVLNRWMNYFIQIQLSNASMFTLCRYPSIFGLCVLPDRMWPWPLQLTPFFLFIWRCSTLFSGGSWLQIYNRENIRTRV
jgi:hypothetical protein